MDKIYYLSTQAQPLQFSLKCLWKFKFLSLRFYQEILRASSIHQIEPIVLTCKWQMKLDVFVGQIKYFCVFRNRIENRIRRIKIRLFLYVFFSFFGKEKKINNAYYSNISESNWSIVKNNRNILRVWVNEWCCITIKIHTYIWHDKYSI